MSYMTRRSVSSSRSWSRSLSVNFGFAARSQLASCGGVDGEEAKSPATAPCTPAAASGDWSSASATVFVADFFVCVSAICIAGEGLQATHLYELRGGRGELSRLGLPRVDLHRPVHVRLQDLRDAARAPGLDLPRLFLGVVRGADQRAGLHVLEAQL